MLTADQRTRVYEDRSKIIAEMAEAFYIFPGAYSSTQRWQSSIISAAISTSIIFHRLCENIDIFLQEDQLMCTKVGFSLVPVPGYLPNSNDLEQINTNQIIQTASDEVNSISKEMQVIM